MKNTTAQMFAHFYDKPYDEITREDMGSAEEIDWGEDVGGEILTKELKGEAYLEEYFGKPIEDIKGWEGENIPTGDPVGEEEW